MCYWVSSDMDSMLNLLIFAFGFFSSHAQACDLCRSWLISGILLLLFVVVVAFCWCNRLLICCFEYRKRYFYVILYGENVCCLFAVRSVREVLLITSSLNFSLISTMTPLSILAFRSPELIHNDIDCLNLLQNLNFLVPRL